MSDLLGAVPHGEGVRFSVRSRHAEGIDLCLFGENGQERRLVMAREGDVWTLDVPDVGPSQPYGYRAYGPWQPERGLWFDPAKLLVDPYAIELDRRFAYDPRLGQWGEETAPLMPKGIVPAHLPICPSAPPVSVAGGLIYEINVRAFTMLHPDIPAEQRGTIAALAHPAILDHLKALHVTAVELMPVVAWIDERHLPPLGLNNAWGYNPVAMMALDPGLAPGGVAELRETVATLHAHGIGVILDLVFNHSGESDVAGPILSMRGLDSMTYYSHTAEGILINDTGCGNTLNAAEPVVRKLILDAMRHFVRHCGVDGFRFDLAPIMARGPGFDPDAPIFAEIAADPMLADRILIAEPWDVGPGGYQLGHFPANWLEWNDRFRDDVRRFWRGDGGVGVFATRLAGSSDIFGPHTRSVNFLAAHDGFTLADTVAYAERHNEANGEANHDGHGENFSWNNGAEGPTDDPVVIDRRRRDIRALLTTIFASTGTVMLTAGDEFGRSQQGNNNAYAQDNEIGWIDWAGRDRDLEAFVIDLAARRGRCRQAFASFPSGGCWERLDGGPMSPEDWNATVTAGFEYRFDGRPCPRVARFDRVTRSACLLIGNQIGTNLEIDAATRHGAEFR
ncbi:glycogen debranching protein GlgX [Sphingomonas oryzagri]